MPFLIYAREPLLSPDGKVDGSKLLLHLKAAACFAFAGGLPGGAKDTINKNRSFSANLFTNPYNVILSVSHGVKQEAIAVHAGLRQGFRFSRSFEGGANLRSWSRCG